MKNLELTQMEGLNGGSCGYRMGVSIGLMAIWIATAFTGVGAVFLFAGAGLGYASSESEACEGQTT